MEYEPDDPREKLTGASSIAGLKNGCVCPALRLPIGGRITPARWAFLASLHRGTVRVNNDPATRRGGTTQRAGFQPEPGQ
jgi:hypothetical protein